MNFDADLSQAAFLFMVAVAVGGMLIGILFPYFAGGGLDEKRVKAIMEGSKVQSKSTLRQKLMAEDPKDSRRKQLQDSLSQLENDAKERKKKLTLRLLLQQAGLSITPRGFWIMSLILGLIMGVAPLIAGLPWYLGIGSFIVGVLGLPRWILRILRTRRQNTFVNDFADAIDVMVRGLKAGLPVTDAMKIIASETGDPVGPEFIEVVEGQRIGIPVDQGLVRMYERVPLSEVNFLGIVMSIQSKTGGNLSEALGNLSRVLRDRKKMKQKIKAVSQEAKASAGIIGSLPFCIMGAMTLLNPNYLSPLWNTQTGNIVVACAGLWMFTGIMVMRYMINFEI